MSDASRRVCRWCGKPLTGKEAGRREFCDRACYWAWRRNADLSDDELRELVEA